VKDHTGVWSATVGPLEPDIYSYTYEVNGATVTDPRNPDVKVWLQSNSMVTVPGAPARTWEVQDVPHGVVHHHTYQSRALGQSRELYVYTPPGYSPASRSLPVIYLKHGFGDGPSAWTDVGRAHVIADNLIAQKKAVPAIIVTPYGHVRSPRFARAPSAMTGNDEGVERELVEDVIPMIEATYRASKRPADRAIIGLSMGGGQALATGLARLDRFQWIAAFSSATPTPRQGTTLAILLKERFPALATESPRKLKLLWIGCGKEDFLVKRNEAFVAALKEAGIAHTWRLTEGAHDWTVWRRYLEEVMPLLFR
jgi:enterochelin esterase family protein